jgi:Lon-like ATP-dependent protease
MGSDSGSVLPIMAEVTPAQGASGTVIATGMLKEIAQESIKNVSAILKKFTGRDVKNVDIHIQFIGTYGGVEGDSASISVATAVISAIEGIPVRQDVAMTGSLSVRGDVLPVGGVTYKIEAAAKAGIKIVLIPRTNINDVLIEERYRSLVTVVPVDTIDEVLKYALVPENAEGFLSKLKKMTMRSTTMIPETPVCNPVP